jgi:hypothetical protein
MRRVTNLSMISVKGGGPPLTASGHPNSQINDLLQLAFVASPNSKS